MFCIHKVAFTQSKWRQTGLVPLLSPWENMAPWEALGVSKAKSLLCFPPHSCFRTYLSALRKDCHFLADGGLVERLVLDLNLNPPASREPGRGVRLHPNLPLTLGTRLPFTALVRTFFFFRSNFTYWENAIIRGCQYFHDEDRASEVKRIKAHTNTHSHQPGFVWGKAKEFHADFVRCIFLV